MIKKGINIWSFPEGEKFEKIFEISKDAGFEGVELCLSLDGELNINSTEQDILKIKKLATDIGLELPSFASELPWHYSLSANDKKLRCQGVEYLKKQIEIASMLGSDTVLVVPGFVGVDFVPVKDSEEIVEYTEVYERSQESIRQVLDTAKKYNIIIGIENVWNKFLLSPLEFLNFIKSFNNDYVGAFFDVGNVIATGFPEQWIKILSTNIKKIHFKDYRRNVGTIDGFVDLLSGDVNYPLVINELEKIGYDNYCIAEMVPIYKYYPYQSVYNASSSMDVILKRKSFK